MAFLQSVDLFCVPTVYPESKGLSVLEALAAGVPVVVPAHGTFPELLADTGGGLLCQPLDPGDLAARLAELLLNPTRAEQLGRAGQQAIEARYQARAMARATVALYRQLA
jgi:glycosyltransferase involved in cell wall biosynthesis